MVSDSSSYLGMFRALEWFGDLAAHNAGPSNESPVPVHTSADGNLVANFDAQRGEEGNLGGVSLLAVVLHRHTLQCTGEEIQC